MKYNIPGYSTSLPILPDSLLVPLTRSQAFFVVYQTFETSSQATLIPSQVTCIPYLDLRTAYLPQTQN